MDSRKQCDEEDKIYILTDVPINAGIGIYAWSLFNLLKTSFPCLEFYFIDVHNERILKEVNMPLNLYKSKFGYDAHFMKWLTYRKFANNELSRNSNVHLCGVEYSLTSKIKNSIVTVHDIFFRKPQLNLIRYNPYELATLVLIDMLIPLNIRRYKHAKALVSNSEVVKNDLQEKYSLESKLINLWIDEARFKTRNMYDIRTELGLPFDKKILLNVSGPGVNKNLRTLEKIASSLDDDFILVKIGYPIKDPKVMNLGKVCDELYPLYFSASDAYLNTSTDEGFGIPLIESIGSGMPVVSPRVSTFPNILGDSAAYVNNPFNKIEYLKMIDFILENRNEYSQKAVIRSKMFSSQLAKENYKRLYSEVFELKPIRGA